MLRRLFSMSLVALMAMACVVEVSEAQRRRGGEGGGQRKGEGGQRQRQRGSGGFGFGGGGVAGILNMEEVQKELSINEEQKGLIAEMREQMTEQMRELFGGGGQLSREERTEKMQEVQKQSEEMVAIILEPEQMKRAKELALQRSGIRALLNEEVAKELGVDEETQGKIRETMTTSFQPSEEMRELFAKIREMSDEERQEAMTKMRATMEKRRKESDAKVLALLSDEQKKKFASMQGKKFEFPQSSRGGFGGRSRGGRGGEGGRRRGPDNS